MDVLHQIISLMNKEEVRHFKLFAARTQVEGDRKDLQLFDAIRRQPEEQDEERIFHKLYKGEDKNPYYRLKNRLLTDINKSLNLQHMDDDDTVHMFHLLSMARFFHNRDKYHIAFHYIRKAEKKAIKLENYELLDFIYSELIKLSHEIIFINPEEYIQKRKENREKLLALREIDDILAAVIYRLKVTQNFSSTKNPIFDLLQKTVDEFTQNSHTKQDPKLRFTIYHAVSRILLARKDYDTLETYLMKTYEEFTSEGLFNKSNHDTKLQLLVYIVNTLYKTRKLELSLQYAERLKDGMEEHNRLFNKKYEIYYLNALIINYSILDVEKSIKILDKVLAERTFKEYPYNEFIMIVNLSICHFRLHKITKALRTLVQAYIHDGYKGASDHFRLKIAIFELTVRLEAGDFEITEKRIEDVKKEYAEILGNAEVVTENKLLSLIGEMNRSVNIRADKNLIRKVRDYLSSESRPELEEFSFIDYHEWLRNKVGLEDSVGA
jgi:hypothetical protein